jgi:tetratricopeptide (TPR) repeat protein
MGNTVLRDAQGAWNLQLFGDFRLSDPSGAIVRLPNRKVEALLAVLALHRRYGVSREWIAEQLWHDSPEANRRTNLRQAVKLLRASLGDGVLEDSRAYCRLSCSFLLDCDYDRPNHTSSGFMPGHDGNWFEGIRSEHCCESDAPAGVLSNLLETCRWFARHDPKAMFSLLKVNPALTRGMNFRDMRELLDLAGEDAVSGGWSFYWRGTAEDDLRLCAELLRSALKGARRTQDLELASEVCLELGKVYARTGEFARAERICDLADAVASDAKCGATAVIALRLRGIVFTHWGRHDDGLELLERSEPLLRNPVERAVALGVRAFFEASIGRYERARDTFESRSREVLNMGHRGVDCVGSMTEAMLAVAGNRRSAIEPLERLSAECSSVGSTQFGVYADELLAKLFYLEGERDLAGDRLTAARRGRSVSRMAVTPLEAQRLAIVS